MIKIEREHLAKITFLTRILLQNKILDVFKAIELEDAINKARILISNYDKEKEIKEIGNKYKQSKLF